MKDTCKRHARGDQCGDCGYGRDLFEPLKLFIRQFPKWVQLVFGIPFCILATKGWYDQVTHVPQPGEPQKAFWVTLILFVVAIVVGELIRPKPPLEDARPAGLGDFQFPTATEGRPVPLVWGTVRQKGPNVVWYGDLSQKAIEEKVKTGLWSSERFIKGFSYTVGVQMALARGAETAPCILRRVWIGDDVVFTGTVTTGNSFDIDAPELFGGVDLGNGGIQARCDFYGGTRTQAVNTYLNDDTRQRITTAATPTAPRYSGTCYVVARALPTAVFEGDGAYLGTSTTIKPWSFEIQRFPALFSGQGGSQNRVGTFDANPVNVVYELLTNVEWGFGFPVADIDVGVSSSFKSAADTMITEGNGMSLLIDREMSAKDLLQELQRQMDGVVFLNQRTGKWSIKLARADYDINTVPQLTDSNVVEVRDYTRGSWEDTTNTIKLQYDKRDDDYKQSFALAQDMGNALIRGDGTVANAQAVTAATSFPGVKDSALASNIAWRELRGHSYPLVRCQLVVNRQMWNVNIGDVVAWTNARLGFVKLPMRITRIDFGTLQSNRMTLTVVQDVFKFAAASMGTPTATGWTPPTATLAAFPADEIVVQEAPRAIVVRDPAYGGDPTVSKVFAAARRQTNEVAFDITQRNAVSTPVGGSFADAGTVFGFVRIGELVSALNAGTAIPTSTITIDATPDTQTLLEAAFDDSTTTADMGVDLVQMVMVGNEFMLVQSAANNGGDVDLQNVYRGALDSAQENHAAGTPVFLLHLGAGLTDTSFPTTNYVDIALRMRAAAGRYTGAVTPVNLQMAQRTIRPYPPAASRYNGSGTNFGTPSMEGSGAGENTYGIGVAWLRRALDPVNEVTALLSDNTAVTNEYRVRAFVDPDGANTEIPNSPTAWAAGNALASPLLRKDFLAVAPAGTKIRIRIETRLAGAGLTSRYNLIHDVTPTSANDGLFYLGGEIAATVASNAYVVAAAGVHTLRIGAAYGTAIVQYRVNGGSWTTGITAGATSGATSSLSISDTLEVRTNIGGATPDGNFVSIDNPSAARVAYGTFSS